MQQVYFLIPGLVLPEKARPFISAGSLETLSRLSSSLTDDPVRQDFAQRPFSRSVHLIWAWSVLCRRALPFVSAPYVWSVNQGPQLAGEVWQLTLARAGADGALAGITPTDEAVEAFAAAMTAPLAQRGFRLQRWDRTLYLTRKTPWGVAVRPFEALEGRAPEATLDLAAAGDDAAAAERALRDLRELTAQLQSAAIESAAIPVNALWIHGGGRYSNFYPPTRIRSVLTDIDAITGWALAAGILNHRLGRARGAQSWPADAPNGECIAVLDALYAPWLREDWAQWQQRLEGVVEQVEQLGAAARAKGCDHAVVVGCGEGLTMTLMRKNSNPRSFLARLAAGRKMSAEAWAFQDPSFEAPAAQGGAS